VGGDASFFLWVATPDGDSSETFAAHLLEDGIVCAPGSFFGAAGEGYVRIALVPTVEDCERAAALLVRRFGA
jgi:acetylornithine aminotransferase